MREAAAGYGGIPVLLDLFQVAEGSLAKKRNNKFKKSGQISVDIADEGI